LVVVLLGVQLPVVQTSVPEHGLQAPPPLPQAASELPAEHVEPLQHPLHVFVGHDAPQPFCSPAHLLVQMGVQLPPHFPEPQVCPVWVQSAQAPPPLPQTLSWSPFWQPPLVQQPLQVAVPQEGPLAHTPVDALHVAPVAPQLVHGPPCCPQAESLTALTHWLPWQHVLQVAGPQVAVPWQLPSTQAPLPLQSTHWKPAFPQLATAVPETHSFPLQQPVHVAGPQGWDTLLSGARDVPPVQPGSNARTTARHHVVRPIRMTRPRASGCVPAGGRARSSARHVHRRMSREPPSTTRLDGHSSPRRRLTRAA
jgi:hypothetical protein